MVTIYKDDFAGIWNFGLLSCHLFDVIVSHMTSEMSVTQLTAIYSSSMVKFIWVILIKISV